ncbi:MAG TPA: hypothetical protein VEQ42_09745 [Pyrinomonadaceae bacterium]|nr:hypothetical protein [Pyrinomonadaceae bacterium]
MTLIPWALVSCAAAAFVSLALLYAGGEPLSAEDASGFAVFAFFPALLMCAASYAPGLFWLRRRVGGCRPAYLFPVFSATLLNLPAAAVLAAGLLLGNFSGAGEVAVFLPAYVAAGLIFGLGFLRHCRRAEVRGRVSEVS